MTANSFWDRAKQNLHSALFNMAVDPDATHLGFCYGYELRPDSPLSADVASEEAAPE